MRPIRILPAGDSRDPKTDDPTNVWIIHPAGRLLLPLALGLRIPANAVSVAGLLLGAGGALALYGWGDPARATLGFLLLVAWMIADGLDGMIARATGTTSNLGRFLDGLCDHLVFLLLYVALAASLATAQALALALAAGAAHAVQSTLYEAERTRFHRRIGLAPPSAPPAATRNLLVRCYDAVAGSLDRLAEPCDRMLSRADGRTGLAALYRGRAAAPLKLMALLSNNSRVLVLYLACLAGDPRLFWGFELGPLTVVAVVGIVWHRRVEARLVREGLGRALRAGGRKAG